ncbi:hypothetical protein JYB87_02415 [Shewanella avicenniae]|uniref:Phosphoinositide phospholipase C, Ca2+-dependent n=1 Tax=Shewanella avicenniae TaxID=2814294 RepID=A0ABX7QT53_9GAMM|nr:Ca2+-dependent phosphoinositide-specific phospholipase C [Shewanella avicenniae]QSX34121.1 hypothetical protein JYB87_02415 [Shewanella avicenniae]
MQLRHINAIMPNFKRRLALCFYCLFGLMSATSGATTNPTITAAPLKITDYQFVGSHNSYKQQIPSAVGNWIQQQDPQLFSQINYYHLPLLQQLDLGLRQLEIDVLDDPDGKRFSDPLAGKLTSTALFSPAEQQALGQPGFKVFHIPDIDVRSDCLQLTDCLQQLKQWSQQHPQHLPLFILMNVKERKPDFIGGAQPAQFNAATFERLQNTLRASLGDALFTPSQLQGDAKSVRQAVLRQGWPTVEQLRGRFIFIFDGNAPQQQQLRAAQSGQPLFFASYASDDPAAALMICNDPITQQQQIKQLVQQGFLVRTRADADFSATTTQRQQQFAAAVSSGAQLISTDFYPTSPQATQSGWQVTFANRALWQVKNYTNNTGDTP